MNNQAAIRAIYPQIDWDEYDREVADRERKATVERAVAAVRALPGACHDTEGLGCDSYPCEVNVERAAVLALLDAEAAR